MNFTQIIKEITDGLTGDYQKDMLFLNEQAEKYKNHKDASEILSAIGQLSYDALPQDKKDEMKKQLFVGEKRMDEIFREVNTLITEHKLTQALEKMETLIANIKENFPIDDEADAQFFSFKVPLEECLYSSLWTFKPAKRVKRTPYDFSNYYTTYGFILIELDRVDDAIEALKIAIKYNPINANPYFELCEAYKLKVKNPKLKDEYLAKILQIIKDTLKICLDRQMLARCYCNMGYFCVEKKAYDEAVCFYYQSVMLAPNEQIKGELYYIAQKKGTNKIDPPNKEQIAETFDDYDIQLGANNDVVNVAYGLGKFVLEKGDKNAAKFYLSVAYGLTLSPEIKSLLDTITA